MVASTESGRSRTLNKESDSDIIPSLRGDDTEPANTRILRRATLKIDFYLIPIVGMFCVSPSPLAPLLLLPSAHIRFRSFVILGECMGDRTSGGIKNGRMIAG